jgi:two-component system response regulator MtrA
MARIVVADDDADIRDLVVFRLQQSGHQVRAFGDGLAAVEACLEEQPDLVVLDVMMPKLTGLEACRALRTDPATEHLPVVLLTARAQAEDIELGREAGADAYLAKPFSPPELDARVSELLTDQRS